MFNKKTKPTTFGGEMRDVASKTIDNDNDTFTDRSADLNNGTFGAARRQTGRETRSFDLDLLSQEELNSLMSEVSSRITNKRLADRNLEREFEAQLNLAKRIQEDLLTFEAEPKEKISALNAVTSILKELTKLREDLQTIEDLRRVEAALLEAIGTLPEAEKVAFLDRYEEIYEAMSR